MQKLAALGVVIVLSIPLSVWADVEDDVAAATQAWADAYNSHDPERVASMYDSNAVFWGTTSPTLRTTPAARLEYFSSLANRPNAFVEIGEHEVRVYADVALNTGYYTFRDNVDGEGVVRPSRFSFAYRLQDGEWLIVDHHSSRVPR